jgi:hypothetical protein
LQSSFGAAAAIAVDGEDVATADGDDEDVAAVAADGDE